MTGTEMTSDGPSDGPERRPSSGLRAVRRERATQQVRDQLLAALESGEYMPGHLLPSERVLCETFGVSRVSVREAIAGLEAVGLIAVQHGKGAFVCGTLSEQVAGPLQRYLTAHHEELLDLLRVRGALDELAAEEAALRGTDAGLKRMTVMHEAFRRSAEQPKVDFARLGALDVEFHLSIAKASRSALLQKLLEDLHAVMADPRRMTTARSDRHRHLSVAQHQAIVDAILARNAPRARKAAGRHLVGRPTPG